MPVIYELRGKTAALADLGLNLYSGCAVGCHYCGQIWSYRMTWEQWTQGARPRKNILFELTRDAKRLDGDPANSGQPFVGTLSIGRGGPADAKSPSILRAISPSRATGDDVRHAERAGF